MLTKVGPNKLNFYGGIIFFIIIFPVVLGYFVYHLISTLSKPDIHGNSILEWAIIIIILLLFEGKYMPQVYAMPYCVIVNDALKTVELKYFFQKSKLVRRENMLSYSDTAVKETTRSGTRTYSGIYLHLGDGKKVLFSERDLEVDGYVYIQSMLAQWSVKKGEDE